jgi:hypothetical protein
MLYDLPMSQEEKDSATLRMLHERKEAKEQFTLLMLDVKARAEKLAKAGTMLSSIASIEADKNGFALLLEVIADGGLDKLKSLIEKRNGLKGRISVLDQAARELGFD